MHKSTRSISLVLLGSSLFLAGCRQRTEEEQQRGAGVGTSRVYVPYVRTGGLSAGSSQGGATTHSVGTSARGGFGGHAAASASS